MFFSDESIVNPKSLTFVSAQLPARFGGQNPMTTVKTAESH
jgi:hypothetical protein